MKRMTVFEIKWERGRGPMWDSVAALTIADALEKFATWCSQQNTGDVEIKEVREKGTVIVG